MKPSTLLIILLTVTILALGYYHLAVKVTDAQKTSLKRVERVKFSL